VLLQKAFSLTHTRRKRRKAHAQTGPREYPAELRCTFLLFLLVDSVGYIFATAPFELSGGRAIN